VEGSTVRRAAPTFLAVALAAAARPAEPPGPDGDARGAVTLGGEWAEVRWTDGDTFRVLTGALRGRSVRLAGVNALETFGPVHRIGGSGGEALLALARRSAALAAAAGGPCEVGPRADGYGRLLAACPRAAEALVRSGHAMVLAVDGPPDPGLLALQEEAQRAGRGMWAGGAPPLVPTSVHSADERDLGPRGAYDRVADTRTGRTEVRSHRRRYLACEEVCVGEGADRACLTYVPFERRYRDRPACLLPSEGRAPAP
jgi:endonuclease YncB( thermonuclease family)